MGSLRETKTGSDPHSVLQSYENFYKWYLPIQSKYSGSSFNNNEEEESSTLTEYLFNGKPPPDEDEEEYEDEDGLLSLDEKKMLELAKKCIGIFAEADVLLELAEGERIQSNFSWQYRPLEAFAALGGQSFLNIYVKRQSDASQSIQRVKNFMEKYTTLYKETSPVHSQYSTAMKLILNRLEFLYSTVFPSDSSHQYNECSLPEECLNAILGIKFYFLAHFDGFLEERASIIDKVMRHGVTK
jgi:hypothetical protein